jgi:hypothetical protein
VNPAELNTEELLTLIRGHCELISHHTYHGDAGGWSDSDRRVGLIHHSERITALAKLLVEEGQTHDEAGHG